MLTPVLMTSLVFIKSRSCPHWQAPTMCLQSSVDQKLKGMSKKTTEKIILNPITNVFLALNLNNLHTGVGASTDILLILSALSCVYFAPPKCHKSIMKKFVRDKQCHLTVTCKWNSMFLIFN